MDSNMEESITPANSSSGNVNSDANSINYASQVTPIKSGLTKKEYEIIIGILYRITNYRDPGGHDVSKDFQRLVNKRILPEYFDIIKEPMAFSTIRGKVVKKQYQNFKSFVRDFALISHNAQVYNRPSALVYADSVKLRELFVEELRKLTESGSISPEDAKIPYLGEIPEVEDSPPPDPNDEEQDDEEEEDDDDEDEDENDETDDERNRRGRRKARRPSSILKGIKADDGNRDDPESQKKRGRPPKVLTPMEARISALLKGLRKFKNPNGDLKILPFERLPDKTQMPEYYQEIKQPIALDLIKKKAKRKKYYSIDQTLKDLELMFENAKLYNREESQVYKDAIYLQQEARSITELEKKKPDSDFVDEDGRLPVSEIFHNGDLWKVGDWVHLNNANDVTKPIVAQIYRTWQDPEGQKWINACWYYRPEQTVHNYEKHFYENEVVKTGQYRDHKIEEVVDRCFVMFFTRFNKGRPRGFPPDREVYVCEARYNEEKFKLNKIKTWASCVPDEVREKDYEMDLFATPKKMKKVPSPIKHLLREDAKENDPLPKPTWGVLNAPPIVGAVHKIPRGPNESPPPEPTPSPPPPEVVRPPIPTDPSRFDTQRDSPISVHPKIVSVPPLSTNQSISQAHYINTPVLNRSTISSTPVAQLNPFAPPVSVTHIAPSKTPLFQSQSSYGQYSSITTPIPQLPKSTSTFNPKNSVNHNSSPISTPLPSSHLNSYNSPRSIEVYTLPDSANSSIPADIRAQFHKDELGRVIFFTVPPVDINILPQEAQLLGHSFKYLADKVRNRREDEKKRKAHQLDLELHAAEKIEQQKRSALRKNELMATQCVKAIEKWSSELRKEISNLQKQL
ncbi:Chromatin structure-remodeling complex subunit rsc1 [Erysiphe necator]|nr:Chromatin structure-remodeling complex subunit rsc1 [Erysiphe necator]